MWGLFRRMRSFWADKRGIFRAWKCWSTFHQLHREYSKHCKILHKQKILDALEEAEKAAAHNDVWQLYRLVRRLAPKTPPKKFQIQPKGHMLSPAEELKALVQFYEELYVSDQAHMVRGTRSLSATFEVTPEEICSYLSQIPLRKAVSSGSVPGVVYRLCAEEIAPTLCQLLQYMWHKDRLLIPRSWCIADLIFLPKPGKKTYEVKDWRPIGLQDAIAKAVMHLLMNRVKPFVQAWSEKYPLFAYMPQRSTRHALQAVFKHCADVRSMCSAEADTIHRRFTGWKPGELCGGLQICLDLSSAFDRVPWSRIEAAFQQAQVPSDLASIVLTWLEHSEYMIRNGTESVSIAVARGVKQGCRASPTIFLAYMTLFCQQLDHILGSGFCQTHLTQYADDTHAAWTFHSYEELQKCIWQLSVIMDTLEDFGMKLNDDKAQALFTVRGSLRQKARKEHTVKIKDELVFCVSHSTEDSPHTSCQIHDLLGRAYFL